jgi:leader peptidase (prepilin peptidase) / N-methyltransferase
MNKELIILLGSVLVDALFISLLAWVSITDVLKRKIPNRAIIVMLIAGTLSLVFLIIGGMAWWPYPLGLIIGFPFIVFWNKGWLGAGDAKLIFVCGFYLGLFHGLLMLGLLAALLLLIRLFYFLKRKSASSKVPLGPFIALSAAVSLMTNYLSSNG